MDTTASQFCRTNRDSPLPSEPTTTTSGPAGTKMTTTLASVSLNGAVAGDEVWTEVYRDAADGADTINSNDLELHAVEVRAP